MMDDTPYSQKEIKVERMDTDRTPTKFKPVTDVLVPLVLKESNFGVQTELQIDKNRPSTEADIEIQEVETGADAKLSIHIILRVTRQLLPIKGIFNVKDEVDTSSASSAAGAAQSPVSTQPEEVAESEEAVEEAFADNEEIASSEAFVLKVEKESPQGSAQLPTRRSIMTSPKKLTGWTNLATIEVRELEGPWKDVIKEQIAADGGCVEEGPDSSDCDTEGYNIAEEEEETGSDTNEANDVGYFGQADGDRNNPEQISDVDLEKVRDGDNSGGDNVKTESPSPLKCLSVKLPKLNVTEEMKVRLTAKMRGVKRSRKQHVSIAKNDRETFSCTDCGIEFQQETDLIEHTLTCYGPALLTRFKVEPVDYQEMGFTKEMEGGQEGDFGEPRPKSPKKSRRRNYKCKMCGLQFLRLDSLRKHQFTFEGDRKLKCKFCNETFTQRCLKRRHEHSHLEVDLNDEKTAVLASGKKDLSSMKWCFICGKLFSNSATVRQHIRRIHGNEKRHERTFMCEKCPYTTKNKSQFEGHQNRHEGVKPFSCQLCNGTYYSKVGLNNHKRWAHNPKLSPESCRVCGKVCRNKDVLKRHTLIHNKMHWCHICDFVGATGSILQNHIRKVHLCQRREKRFSCSVCSYVTDTNCRLENHMRTHSVGDERQQFMCELCGSKFANPSSLSRHRLQHSDEPKHVCNTCGKSFTQKCSLDRHMNAHKGIKRYKCDVCDMAFSQSFPLTKHLQRKHPEYFNELVATGKYKGRQARWVTEESSKGKDEATVPSLPALPPFSIPLPVSVNSIIAAGDTMVPAAAPVHQGKSGSEAMVLPSSDSSLLSSSV